MLSGKLPEWAPPDADASFASRVEDGVAAPPSTTTSTPVRRREPTVEELSTGIRLGNRTRLAQAITLVESNSARHREKAGELLRLILPHAGGSRRIGITGPPGVGKSTFIEALGCRLVDAGLKVAVLAIDPSSSVHRGSILGDKTRMEHLSRRPEAFIRPSPSAGWLGGVARKTRETVILCEAAGFDVVLVETVGVGQSETAVRSMTDHFLLLVLAGAGDELQGIKRGIMELADLFAITKADGANRMAAALARSQVQSAIGLMKPWTEGWTPPVLTCSSTTGDGLDLMWEEMERHRLHLVATGQFEARRREQEQEWLHSLVQERLLNLLHAWQSRVTPWEDVVRTLRRGEMRADAAVESVVERFLAETLRP